MEVHFEEPDLALPDGHEVELRYVLTGLLATALQWMQSSGHEAKRLILSLEHENRSDIF